MHITPDITVQPKTADEKVEAQKKHKRKPRWRRAYTSHTESQAGTWRSSGRTDTLNMLRLLVSCSCVPGGVNFWRVCGCERERERRRERGSARGSATKARRFSRTSCSRNLHYRV